MNSQQERKGSQPTRSKDLLEIRKQIVHLVFLFLAVLFAVAAVGLAWFVNGHSVTANGMAVVTVQDGFELKSDGDADLDSALQAYLEDSLLCWKLSADSNLANYGTQKGLHPNASGSLSFSVVPSADGDLTLRCTLGISPIMRAEDADEKAKATATNILRGHLLFACEYSYEEGGVSKESKALVTVDSGEFRIHLPDAKAKQEYQIRLNWFWPYILYDANNHAEYGKDIASLTANQDFSKYFYYRSGNSEAVDVTAEFQILNQHYNDADQFIGDHVEAVVLVLTADMER